MGWIELANKEFKAATDFFESSLKLQPQNQEALQGLKQIKNKPIPTQIISLCDADQGLILLNQPNPPLAKIVRILNYCDKNTPNATASLLLHGLMARHLARNTNNYDLAIFWLQKAMQTAEPTDNGPAVELAVTYEWAGDPKKALFIYKRLLDKNPHNRSALLGEARVFRMQYFIPQSITIYDQLLKNNPDDVEALNGQAESLMANYQFKQSRALLTKALDIRPGNTESLAALQTLNKSTKYIFGISGGNYSVPPEVSNALNLYFYDNLNATDGLTVFATHNSKQIGESFFSGPTLLPNNSFLIGYQHRIPNKYGWSLNYDYRQHDDLPFENRALVTTNLYLSRNFEWFNGLRAGFSTPWQNQLLFSGLTLYTSLPVNISVTGFWAHQQIGGKSSSYSLDLSKEYASRLFYSFGPSYSPTLKNWEVHGKITLPTFTNQALIADVSHYFFNKSTFLNVGWQFYWA